MTRAKLEARLRRRAIRLKQMQALQALREAEMQMARDKAIVSAGIAAPPTTQKHPKPHYHKLKAENIFHLCEIKARCVSYRLRFLDAHRSSGAMPHSKPPSCNESTKQHRKTLKSSQWPDAFNWTMPKTPCASSHWAKIS